MGTAGRGRRTGARESILDAIRSAEPLSRVELAAMTGLTEAAVSMTVRRLLEEGLLVETGRTPTGGKPRTLLRLDPAARLSVGIHIDEHATTYVLTGQTGGVVSRLARPVPADTVEPDADAMVDSLVTDIGVLLDGSGVDRARCLGIGLVWASPRVVLGPPGDLDRRLAEVTGLPVFVENDATAAAVGEYWVARVGPTRAFAALYMGGGIGAGIVIDGVALRGTKSTAGEFGHLCLQVDGPECWCGSRGCLEALAGPQVVVRAARADPVAAAEAGLTRRGRRRNQRQAPSRGAVGDFAAVARAARAGAPACRALLDDSARYVAAAAESVVNLLDIDLLVLTGPGFAAASFVYGPAITARIATADGQTWHRSVSVTVSLAAATASATGAAALVLQSSMRS